MGCFAYCAQCAFDRLRAMRFGDFGIECAYGAIYAKSIVGPGAGCAGKILAMLCRCGVRRHVAGVTAVTPIVEWMEYCGEQRIY